MFCPFKRIVDTKVSLISARLVTIRTKVQSAKCIKTIINGLYARNNYGGMNDACCMDGCDIGGGLEPSLEANVAIANSTSSRIALGNVAGTTLPRSFSDVKYMAIANSGKVR